MDELLYQALLLAALAVAVLQIVKVSLIRAKQAAAGIPPPPPGPWRLPHAPPRREAAGLPHRVLRDLAAAHGPLMMLRLGETPLVVASSREVAREVLRTHDANFGTRPRLLAGEVVLYGCADILFSPSGEYWRKLRQLCAAETSRRLRVYASLSPRAARSSSRVLPPPPQSTAIRRRSRLLPHPPPPEPRSSPYAAAAAYSTAALAGSEVFPSHRRRRGFPIHRGQPWPESTSSPVAAGAESSPATTGAVVFPIRLSRKNRSFTPHPHPRPRRALLHNHVEPTSAAVDAQVTVVDAAAFGGVHSDRQYNRGLELHNQLGLTLDSDAPYAEMCNFDFEILCKDPQFVPIDQIASRVDLIRAAGPLTLVDVSALFYDITISIASCASFGKKHRNVDEYLSAIKTGVSLASGFKIPDLFPSWRTMLATVTGMRRALEEVYGTVDSTLEDVIEERQGEKEDKTRPDMVDTKENLVDVLIGLHENGAHLSRDSIKAVIFDMFTAETGTLPSALN
uniref:Cytochrome P450 n=1 Tax=Oryza glumipatula TaxID=40148 RepID=A0A0D9YPB7_9ORYZ